MSAPSDSPLVRHWGRLRRPPRRRLPRRLLGLVVLAAAALLVWEVVRAHPWRPPSGTPRFTACVLGDGVSGWCAHVRVPADPARSGGPKLELRVAVLPAASTPAKGALFYLEGGPGVPASRSAEVVAEELGRVGHDRDLVLVDQRGTGGSSAVACPPGRVRADDARAVAAFVRSCFARLPGAVSLLTTANAADDLERVRRALGYGRIDLVGASYGATLAQVYLERHPRSVRSVVLDGASLLGVPVYEHSARNAERALEQVVSRCARAPACRSAYPRTRAQLAALLARGPRRVTIETGTFVLRPADVAWTVAALSQTADRATSIPYAIDAAVHGDYTPLARAFAADVGADLDARARLATFWVILCSEPWAAFDPAATTAAGAGSYLAPFAVARARLFHGACRAVPRVRPDPAALRPVRVPALLLAGGADPDDPPANVAGFRRLLPQGRLVVVPGAGHGTLGYDCVERLVARFVARGSAAGLDARCASRVPAPAFLLR